MPDEIDNVEEQFDFEDFSRIAEKFDEFSRKIFGAFIALEEASKEAAGLSRDIAEAFRMLEEAKKAKDSTVNSDPNNN